MIKKANKNISQIGLPDWIVNLRHNATHFTLPGIEILENARDYLYNWIKVFKINFYYRNLL